MWGRGSADSKVAVAIFCHLTTRLAASTEQLHDSLVLLFDLDEHTGRSGGATRYFEGPYAPSNVAGVMIGYPGMDKLVIGGPRRLPSPTPRPRHRLPFRGKQAKPERDR